MEQELFQKQKNSMIFDTPFLNLRKKERKRRKKPPYNFKKNKWMYLFYAS